MTRSEILQIAKPILFNTEMVRAILGGRKTVTRRVMKPQPKLNGIFWEIGGAGWSDGIKVIHPVPCHSLYNRMPYKPGCYLYVRETWNGLPAIGIFPAVFYYRADEENQKGCKWRPSIHMPKEAARIFLRVTDVKVERLSDMDYMDAIYEGIEPQLGEDGYPGYNPMIDFIDLWDSTIPPKDHDKYGWAANPWVFVIEFERVEVEQ